MGTFSEPFEFTDLVTYGTATPPVGSAPEGAQYFLTSDGTATGAVVEAWAYDAQAEQWVQDPITDPCDMNHFHHTLTPQQLTFAHENTAQSVTVTRGGIGVAAVGVTLENIVGPVTENGGGAITFGAGANNVYNKRANTVESLVELGDYFDIRTNRPAAFRTLQIQLTTDITTQAQNATDYYKVVITSGGISVRDVANVVVFNTGLTPAGTQRTLRLTKVLTGLQVSFEGNVVYTTPKNCIDYEGIQNDRIAALEATSLTNADTATGFYRLGAFLPATPVDVNNNLISTGFDLTQFPNMRLKILARDAANGRPWQVMELDVDSMLERFAAGDAVDAFGHVFDNDFLNINIIDPATGDIQFIDNGRELQVRWIELWTVANNGEILLSSPNGTVFSLTVDNSGGLVTVAV